MLLDCGLMFPDADMLGIDLVLPGLHLAARERRAHRRLHRHPRPRGPRRRPVVPAARAVVPGVRLGADARSRPPPHRGGRRARQHRARPGARRRAPRRSAPSTSSSCPSRTRCPHGFATAFHTPQGTILHTGDWKLDLTPVDGRLTDLARIGAIASRAAGIRSALLGDSTNAEEPGHTRVGAVGRRRCSPTCSHAHHGRRIVIACFASHIHRIQQICDAAVDRRPHRRHPRPVDEEERAAGPRRWGCCTIPDDALVDIAERRRPRPGRGVRHLAPAARASRCRPSRSWRRARTGGSSSAPRTP